ncbi:AraC family transcriptional regulator [Dongia sedimenti]|uniref:AraC family transcriptional regulator n=1 Tax=Dongia sedimenti TaxID=3064282 RepID=A0ABU0YT99_9PROT|nr:AraC family transcriptional regulator [Rhodospirillaceae bacterium R-7]
MTLRSESGATKLATRPAERSGAVAVAALADTGQAIDFRSAVADFGIRLSSSGPRRVAEHAHDNIQISIPLGATIANVAWRARGGDLKHALARRGHALIVPARQRHAVAWKNRARFVNIHLSAATASDERYGFLRRIARLGEAHVVEDPFLARLGEIIVLRAAKQAGLDAAALESFRMIVETHVMNPYGASLADAAPVLAAAGDKGLSAPALKKVTAAIRGDLARDWTVDVLAGTVGLSAGHFSRSFRHATGASPRQWLIQQRIDAAIDRLLMTRDPLSEIAIACGFAEQAHFTRTFTRLVGTSPGAWRRRHQP